MTLPFAPQEARESNACSIPVVIINAVNKLLAENIGMGRTVTLKQDDILEAAGAGKDNNQFRQQIFDRGWLNLENVYSKYGWKVTYDKPAYCETYPATFTFKVV